MSKESVKKIITSPKIKTLYTNTYYSLVDRIKENGYLEESFIPNRYSGSWSRSNGAYVFFMIESNNIDLAIRSLRFILDTMKRNNLLRPPHVSKMPIVNEDGSITQDLDMVNQLDGTAHIISAYAELITTYKRTELYEEYWDIMSSLMSNCADQPYFFSNKICGYPVANINLFLNTCFEHSREHRYWCCFDLLTQSFMGASLKKMAKAARLYNHLNLAKFWEEQLDRLKNGIENNLTMYYKDKLIYAEMRLPNSNNGELYDGIGWVNLSPIAACWEALDESIMKNTIEALHDKLWLKDPSGSELYYLEMDSKDKIVIPEIIGKGIGWDIEASRRLKDFSHIYDILEFLINNHKEDLYCEYMIFNDNVWQTGDCGNAEQCIWWCWAMARLYKEFNISPIPNREEITVFPLNK